MQKKNNNGTPQRTLEIIKSINLDELLRKEEQRIEKLKEEAKTKKEAEIKAKQKLEEKELKKALKRQKILNSVKTYVITYPDDPDIAYISFQKGMHKTAREKAEADAYKYFKNAYHPMFQKRNDYTHMMKTCKHKRVSEFDQYAKEGKVPVPKVMEVLGYQFRCGFCGKGTYSYNDYNAGRCFYVEGEGDINDFVKGIVVCYHCYKKYIEPDK